VTETERDVELRRAGPDDAPQVAEVYLRAIRATYSFPLAHTDEQVRGWIRDVVIPRHETWVAEAVTSTNDAERGPRIVGFMSLDGPELDQLYMDPGWTRRRIGGRLVDLAKSRRPGGLALYTFQVNVRARAFYERHGFVVVDLNDGDRNEERQPDARYAWVPTPEGDP
jgi:ribosomal protein S18 acetylase RimI-like enzyme